MFLRFFDGALGLVSLLLLLGAMGCSAASGRRALSARTVPRVPLVVAEDGESRKDLAEKETIRLEFELSNGLTVVLEENHTAPVVAMQAWVRVGSADEPVALAGIAHLFEHMLFKGTKKRPVGAIAREVEGAGGDINAWTSYDETVYHLVLAREHFDTGLDILADALQNAAFNGHDLEKERDVVIEEVRQGLDDPDRLVAQDLFRLAYPNHPYGRPIIGSESSVRSMARAEVQAFFKESYTAKNMTLVVVGDFDAVEAKDKVSSAFGSMASGKRLPKRVQEKEQSEARVRVFMRDVQEAQVLIGLPVPDVSHEDVPVLDLLAMVLGQGDSSRLNLELVRNQQVVSGAFAYVFSARDPGLFVAGIHMPPGRIDDGVGALSRELVRVTQVAPSVSELERAKTILESDRIFDKETVQGYARKLGFFATVAGDLKFEDTYLDRVRETTPGDVLAVARKYLRPDRFNLVAQVPEATFPEVGAADGVVADADTGGGRRMVGEETKLLAHATGPFRVGKKGAPRAEVSMREEDGVFTAVLPGGPRVVMLPDKAVPIISLRGVWKGGVLNERPSDSGVSNLIGALMTKGTKSRDAERLIANVEGMAGSLAGVGGRNSVGIQGEFLARHWERGLELFFDCLQHATFSESELDKERRLVIDELRAQDDNLGHVAFHQFHETLWSKHPYRLNPMGNARAVSGVTRQRLLKHFRSHYPIDALTIAVVGDFDPLELVEKMLTLVDASSQESEVRRLPNKALRAQRRALANQSTGPRVATRFTNKQQAHLVLGFPGVALDSADRFALEILAQVLSGQGGRLFDVLREQRGLVYQVSALSMEGVDPGYFAVYAATSPGNVPDVLAQIRVELERLRAESVPTDELERAKRYLIGAHAIGLQRKGAVAAALAFQEAYGQGWQSYRDYARNIRGVTPRDLIQVAKKYLVPTREVLSLVRSEDPS